MPILTETKKHLDEQFGTPTKAEVLIGGEDLFQADKAYCYTLGRFRVTVGFNKGSASYAVFAKDRLDDPAFSEHDAEVALAIVSPDTKWSDHEIQLDITDGQDAKTKGSTWIIAEYQTEVKDRAGKMVQLIASHRTTRPHFFAYVPLPSGADGPDKFDNLIATMNSAPDQNSKIDAIAALLTELVAAHKGRR